MLYLVFASLFLLSVSCHEPGDFTENDFDKQVAEYTHTLIMFHAPWCGHCKKLKPHFTSASIRLFQSRNDVRLALVDCTTSEKICSRFSVTGYPTVKLFHKGELSHDFDGERSENGIINYINKRTRPTLSEISTASDFEKNLKDGVSFQLPIVVSYISPSDTNWLDGYTELALDMFGEANFLHTNEKSILGVTDANSIVRVYRPRGLLTKMEEPFVDYDGELKVDFVRAWILKTGQGLVGYRTKENVKYFPLTNLMILYNNASAENYLKGVNYYRNRLMRAIQSSSVDDKLVCAYSYSNDFYNELSELQRENVAEFPFVVIYSEGKKYLLEKYSPDALVEFLKGFKSGTLTPHIKSEEIPADDSEPLKKVVTHTFDKVINDDTKDVLVMFHAPWCGHCKTLMPKFKEAANKLSEEPSVLLVIYDATANEVPPPYHVSSFPTLYFVPMSKKDTPELYKGGRETDDIVKYLASESTEELRGFDREGHVKKSDL